MTMVGRAANCLRAALAASLILLAPATRAAHAAEACPFAGQKPWLIVQLYFGQSANGRAIAPGQWRAFLREVVTARFPDGLTVHDAYGQWKDPGTGAVVREKSKIVQIAVEDTDEVRRRVSEVADAYIARFHQKSVGIVTTDGCAAF